MQFLKTFVNKKRYITFSFVKLFSKKVNKITALAYFPNAKKRRSFPGEFTLDRVEVDVNGDTLKPAGLEI